MTPEDALALAKSYVKKTLAGAGALKGDPGVGIATVEQTTEATDSGGVNVITVTKTDGTSSTFNVRNGVDGADGATIVSADINASGELVQHMSDGQEINAGTVPSVKGDPGYSPTATVERNATDDGVVITITDESGTTNEEVKDGKDGAGVPPGGTTGQILTKKSDADVDLEWTDPAAEITTDAVPTEGSTNPVQSGGTYNALQETLKAAQEYADAKLHLSKKVVTVVPSVDEAEENVIYLLKVDTATGSDVYQEWQLIDGEMRLTGDTSTDLSGYAKTVDLEQKQDKLTGTAGQIVGFDENGNPIVQDMPKELPTGGTAGQVLTKSTDDDYDAEWKDAPAALSTTPLVYFKENPTLGDVTNGTVLAVAYMGRIGMWKIA